MSGRSTDPLAANHALADIAADILRELGYAPFVETARRRIYALSPEQAQRVLILLRRRFV